MSRFYLFVAIIIASTHAADDPPKLTQSERPPQWLAALENLRIQPRPGDIQNAGILVNIGDVVETTPEQKKSSPKRLLITNWCCSKKLRNGRRR